MQGYSSLQCLIIFSEIRYGYKAGMAYRLNLAYNWLLIFDQSQLPITDMLSVLSFTDTDNRIQGLPEYHINNIKRLHLSYIS